MEAYHVIRMSTDSNRQLFTQLHDNFEFRKIEGELLTRRHQNILLDQDRVILLLCHIDNFVVGYSITYLVPSLYSNDFRAYLYDIEVLPSHRKKGVGKRLMEKLLALVQLLDIEELWLGTATDNNSANALYQSTGGKKSPEINFEYTYEFNDAD